jgi:hypothetical protein
MTVKARTTLLRQIIGHLKLNVRPCALSEINFYTANNHGVKDALNFLQYINIINKYRAKSGVTYYQIKKEFKYKTEVVEIA